MGRTRVQKAIASGKATPEDVTKLVLAKTHQNVLSFTGFWMTMVGKTHEQP